MKGVKTRRGILKTARAMVLVRGGDMRNGLPLAMEAAQLCYKPGDMRHLERMFNLQRYLDHMSRDGPTEYTG